MERVDFSEQNLANKLKVGLKEQGLAHAQVCQIAILTLREKLICHYGYTQKLHSV